jgi:hypothetical protein
VVLEFFHLLNCILEIWCNQKKEHLLMAKNDIALGSKWVAQRQRPTPNALERILFWLEDDSSVEGFGIASGSHSLIE